MTSQEMRDAIIAISLQRIEPVGADWHINDYRIATPFFSLRDLRSGLQYQVNEYTLRNIQFGIVKGELCHNQFRIEDPNGFILFEEDGCMTASPKGLDTADNLALEIFGFNRLRDLQFDMMRAKHEKNKE